MHAQRPHENSTALTDIEGLFLSLHRDTDDLINE